VIFALATTAVAAELVAVAIALASAGPRALDTDSPASGWGTPGDGE
jgi:hypothetical protein